MPDFRPKGERWRGGLSVLAYSAALALNSWDVPLLGGVLIILGAVVWNVYLFWPQISALRIVHPKGAVLQSPKWLYIFSVGNILLIAFAFIRLYVLVAHTPAALTKQDFSEPFVRGKYVRIADFADGNNFINGRTFEDCWIYGPAVLYLRNNNDTRNIVFEGPISQIFYGVDSTSQAGTQSGVITVDESRFYRSHFVKVSFIGSADAIDKLEGK
jgi:hypothetical protein